MAGAKLKHVDPCRKCGARMMFDSGESYAVHRRPGMAPDEFVKAPIGAPLLPPFRHAGDVFVFICESCGHNLQAVEAKTARVSLNCGDGAS